MSFDLEEFVKSPSLEALDTAKKDDLIKVAQQYTISEVKQSLKKQVIKNIIIKYIYG